MAYVANSNHMPLVAILTLPQPILGDWLVFIEQRAELVRKAPRDIINPFTGEPTTFIHPASEVDVIVDGETIGTIAPSSWFEDNRELLVFARNEEEPRLSALTVLATAAIGATLEWVGPDHPQRERGQ